MVMQAIIRKSIVRIAYMEGGATTISPGCGAAVGMAFGVRYLVAAWQLPLLFRLSHAH